MDLFSCLKKYNTIKNVLISVTGAINHIPVFPNIAGNKYIFNIRKPKPFKPDIIADCFA
ncbi:MAG: hypothetical protein N4A48_13985 [Tepidibacter sp.]|jgi:hypothetical protein|uniref:hypothetical protein n=1 Tax=Tepidibacter sp. TaxID=2529387 RepID=UPI0025D5D8EB|nr:hypothetical protein [Tepidibacter sp.]MCT4509839.1 hypothetical protein [Tepidibacter sp.]